MPEIAEIPLSELRSKITPDQNGTTAPLRVDEETMRPLVEQIKAAALEFAQTNDAPPWLQETIRTGHHLESIVAYMRHLKDGQVFTLRELQKAKPDLLWNRG